MFEHSLAFDRPAYLLLLLLIPALWWLGYRSLAGLGRWLCVEAFVLHRGADQQPAARQPSHLL